MYRFSLLFICIFSLCFALPEASAEDELIGAVWHLKVKPPGKTKYEDRGLIRCTTDGKVFIDGVAVGTHRNTTNTTVEFKIDKGGPNWNGVGKASMVAKDNSVWEGKHVRASTGEKFPFRLFLKKD
ncbi:hypothetical protein AB1L42_16710 [Thalassoglobus sp. JC818]|uniref:hypothetical protein n=1 Tax=Thalassoglobus sp. JC818 TaxID=3232136 RepID=UPI003458E0C6